MILGVVMEEVCVYCLFVTIWQTNMPPGKFYHPAEAVEMFQGQRYKA